MHRLEATRGLFWDGSRNYEPRSDDEDDIGVDTLTPNFRTTPAGERLVITYDLACNRPHTRWISIGIGFQAWSPKAPEAKTLPLGHSGPLSYESS
ncbi:hypothetical protein AVEN_88908-1 [Araneus ventricosus]|uniref:Uncharacterized protein n=1 Tax=Araneus ventricosus TaxID=182803 RepID=A0A4Y2VM22_ARAVE|nr:hypothetical protein AVEN_88908-1 [Araneus ventricosus]